MAIDFNSSEITQYKIRFYADDTENVAITLTKGFCVWNLEILEGRELTVEEWIKMCNLIYSKKVVDECACIAINFNSDEPTYIRGARTVTSEILKTVKITFPEKDKT